MDVNRAPQKHFDRPDGKNVGIWWPLLRIRYFRISMQEAISIPATGRHSSTKVAGT